MTNWDNMRNWWRRRMRSWRRWTRARGRRGDGRGGIMGMRRKAGMVLEEDMEREDNEVEVVVASA